MKDESPSIQTSLSTKLLPSATLEGTLGSERPYQPHKLIIPVLFTSPTTVEELDRLVTDSFGSIDSRSEEIGFSFTQYYDAELGAPIIRVLYSIEELVDPTELARFKQMSNDVEARTARPDGRRTINLDPGLLSLSRVILATTKPSAHRIPIGLSMYAEITLLYRHGGFEALEWTYPDFRGNAYDNWLFSVRRRYHEQLKTLEPDNNWRL